MSIIDQNRIPVMMAALDSDGETLTNIQVVGNAMSVDDNTTGSDNSSNVNDLRDENFKTALWATSSVDGITPVQLYCDINGKLLINSQ
jgi:hypothetical protein